jgi:hypothetical protein
MPRIKQNDHEQVKYRHCIEVIQEYLLTKDLHIKHIQLIDFQHYVGTNIMYLDDSNPYKENTNLTQIKPKMHKGKLIDDLERWY